ncbi:uncharacterized protein ACA1_344140 [Acanthamoeba castellanii str. Neff]|uniref:Uncharacterized protein n=1 Tax=Acanthamoeba castellanii (strain ATCC 30010 / Neff) TaxID=1257118 RepID=L8GQF9_ACACF|nr:uncharacterized protein ACA1_344140 [Acanthamoeba castellanii str. Neff]ELR14371.1 hypothetical protein ACA1_344140 [Acanthamoeba castellanii str. Neff]
MVGDVALFIGGQDALGLQATLDAYNMSSGQWFMAGLCLLQAWSGVVAMSVGSLALFAGGYLTERYGVSMVVDVFDASAPGSSRLPPHHQHHLQSPSHCSATPSCHPEPPIHHQAQCQHRPQPPIHHRTAVTVALTFADVVSVAHSFHYAIDHAVTVASHLSLASAAQPLAI